MVVFELVTLFKLVLSFILSTHNNPTKRICKWAEHGEEVGVFVAAGRVQVEVERRLHRVDVQQQERGFGA